MMHAALHEKDIQVAIVIKIEKGCSTAHDLRQIEFSSHAVVVLQLESHLLSYLFEDWGRGRYRAC
jgi:hypothetical protein